MTSYQLQLHLGRIVGALSLLAVAAGCPSPDPEGKYDRFNEQTQDQRDLPMAVDLPPFVPPGDTGTGSGSGTEGDAPDIDGVYLLALETLLGPGLPLQFLAEVDGELDVEGNGTATIEFQPLSLVQGCTTEPREEVGDPLVVDVDVTAFAFTAAFPDMTQVTGAANPITQSDIIANLSLEATVRSEDAWCGVVTGMVTSPLMSGLEGSTFAAIRLADRSERPLVFPCKCDTIGAEPGAVNGCLGGTAPDNCE